MMNELLLFTYLSASTYVIQRSVVNQLKSEMEKLQEEIKVQLVSSSLLPPRVLVFCLIPCLELCCMLMYLSAGYVLHNCNCHFACVPICKLSDILMVSVGN